jgi:DNA-binding FadR family transcriptional regulator
MGVGGERRGIADALAESLRERIVSGALRPGERLPPERELALELRVNRGSLREALKKLEQLRLVSIRQGSGIHVCDPSRASFELVRSALQRDGAPDREWLSDLLELRESLLPGVVRLALERASLAECDAAAARLEQAASSELAGGLEELEQALAQMTRNRVLALFVHSLADLVPESLGARARAVLRVERRRLQPLLQRLALALRARDPDTVERALRELLERHSRALLGAVDA